MSARIKIRPLLNGLRLLARGRCENFMDWNERGKHAPLGTCFKNGRTADAEYGSDLACTACIAHAALVKAGERRP